MISSAPQYFESAISKLVPAVLTVLIKMNLCLCEIIMRKVLVPCFTSPVTVSMSALRAPPRIVHKRLTDSNHCYQMFEPPLSLTL